MELYNLSYISLATYVSQCIVDLGGALLVPEHDGVDEPEEVVPFTARDTVLPQQFEDGGSHGGPFVLEGQTFVLQHHIMRGLCWNRKKNSTELRRDSRDLHASG